MTIGMAGKFFVFKRRDDVFISLQTKSEMVHRVVKDMCKNLRIRPIPDISRIATRQKKFPDRHKGGIFAIGHRGHSLYKEGMAGIDINGIIGILPSLRHNDPGLQVWLVKAEIFTNGQRIAHFFNHDHIRPETEDQHGPIRLAQISQTKTRQQQTSTYFFFP